jgi:thiamine biosynthesis lipoprotein
VTAINSFRALGTTAVVAVTRARLLDRAQALLQAELACVDLACSRFREDSELSRVNRAGGGRVNIGSTLHDALAVALRAAEDTDGLVDPTLGVELRNAGYDRTFALVRERDGWHVARPAQARRARPPVELFADPAGVRIPSGIELDLGATAKAFAADRAATRIARVLRTGALVSLGGDVAVAGEPPAGGWCILIADRHDDDLEGPGPRVAITAGGVATSSTVGRRWQTDAGEAHHVLDPRTGAPTVSPWRTISVAAPTCVAANVAATAGLVLGGAAPAWLEGRALPARLVSHGGSVHALGGWPDDDEAIAC